LTIKPNDFLYDLIETYKADIEESSTWLFGCDSISTDDVFINSRNTQKSIISNLEATIFGIQLSTADFSYMVPIKFWTESIIYDMYDDTKDMTNLNYYVIVRPEIASGDYEVFKCISNGAGAPSTIKPQINGTINLLDGIYRLADGYVWKYMTTITNQTYNKFVARRFAPIQANSQVESIATDGIDFIEVLNPDSNNGYSRFIGSVFSIATQNTEYLIDLQQGQSYSEIQNFYRNMSLFVQKSGGGSKAYKIIASNFISNTRISVTIEGVAPGDTFKPLPADTIEILPRVSITGTGSGATAIPVFDTSNTRIVGIRMLTVGSGYINAVAAIENPNFFSEENPNRSDVRCLLRPIIPPQGGHGANIIRELNCKTLGISTNISSLAPSVIPATNTYSKVLLVKEPAFSETPNLTTFDNRLKITCTDAIPEFITVGSTVTQLINGEQISGIVHAIVGNILYLTNYNGPVSNIFTDSQPLLSENNQSLDINTIEYPTYTQRSGTVLYITEFLPIERTSAKTEQIKLVIDF
jgi:hypothetical protein